MSHHGEQLFSMASRIHRSEVHGLREVNDTFDGLIAVGDTALFGPDVLVEPASIDDIVAHLSQPVEGVSLP